MTPTDRSTTPRSQEYHSAHLSFARVRIVEAAANREPILNLLHLYTADVRQAEHDRLALDEEQH